MFYHKQILSTCLNESQLNYFVDNAPQLVPNANVTTTSNPMNRTNWILLHILTELMSTNLVWKNEHAYKEIGLCFLIKMLTECILIKIARFDQVGTARSPGLANIDKTDLLAFP